MLNFIWKNKNLRMAKAILNTERTAGYPTIPGFKMCYRAVVIKPTRCWYKDRHMDQWNPIEDPNKLIRLWTPDI